MRIFKYEIYVFSIIIFISAIPILFNQYFPTLDGPAHLHNGNLLKHLLFYKNYFAYNYYEINASLNTNFIDHIWFAVGGLFLPSNWVEKSFLLTYACLLPISFRYCMNNMISDKISAAMCSYLIFPFIYSFSFRIGFFNFCFGLHFVFFTIGLWHKMIEKHTIGKMILLIILTTLVYVSHVLNFVFLLVILMPYNIIFLIKWKTEGIKVLKTIIAFAPSILLFVLFYINNKTFSHEQPKYIALEKLWQILYEMSTLITLNHENEIFYTRIIFICIIFLLVIALIIGIKKRSFSPQLLFSSIIMLFLFFLLPDWMESGGIISYRLAMFFFLILLLFIGKVSLSYKILLLPIMVLIVNHMFYISYHYKQTKALNEDVLVYVEAEQYIENNKVVLPLNYSDAWIQINNACYISTEKNIINLDNYEAAKPHFPLICKKGEKVYDHMLKYGDRNPPCIDIDNYEMKTKHRIDYITRFAFNGDKTDSCTAIVENELSQKFTLIHESQNKRLQLYKRK